MKLFRRCSLHVFLLIFTRSSCVDTLCFKKCNTLKSICTVYYNVWMRRQCDAWSKADRKSAVINSGRKSTKILRRSRQARIKSTIIIYTESTKTAAAGGGGVVWLLCWRHWVKVSRAGRCQQGCYRRWTDKRLLWRSFIWRETRWSPILRRVDFVHRFPA